MREHKVKNMKETESRRWWRRWWDKEAKQSTSSGVRSVRRRLRFEEAVVTAPADPDPSAPAAKELLAPLVVVEDPEGSCLLWPWWGACKEDDAGDDEAIAAAPFWSRALPGSCCAAAKFFIPLPFSFLPFFICSFISLRLVTGRDIVGGVGDPWLAVASDETRWMKMLTFRLRTLL